MSEERDWIVRMRCTVTKEVVVGDCTEEQAGFDPFAHNPRGEVEISMSDWEVLSVEPHE